MFAIMGSLMNLALSASELFTGYLNDGFAVTQQDYSNLGKLDDYRRRDRGFAALCFACVATGGSSAYRISACTAREKNPGSGNCSFPGNPTAFDSLSKRQRAS